MNEFVEKIFVFFPTHPSYLNDIETTIPKKCSRKVCGDKIINYL